MPRRLVLVLTLASTFALGAPILERGAGVAEAQRAVRLQKGRAAPKKARKKARRTARRARQTSLRREARQGARRGDRARGAANNPLRRGARGGRVARAASRTGSALERAGGRAARASWRTARDSARLHLGKRAPVRRNLKEARQAMRQGRAGDAARQLTKAQLRGEDGSFSATGRGKESNQRLGLRERFALWRARYAVKRTSRKLLESRAQAGDLAGVEDAVASLEAFEARGHMGAYARYKVNKTKRESFRKTALALTARGDVAGARKALGRALELSGRRGALGRFASGFENRKVARQVFDQALAMGKHYAKNGRPDLVAQVADFATQVAVASGLRWRARRLSRRAPRMMKRANRKLLGTYLAQANKLYRTGEITEAAYTYLAAQEIPVKRSIRQRRAESRIRRNLGHRLDGLSLEDLQQQTADTGGGAPALQPNLQ